MAQAEYGVAVLRLEADPKNLRRDLDQEKAGVGQRMGSIAKVATGIATAALAGIATASVGAAKELEKGFAEVRTLLPDISNQGFGEVRAGLRDLQAEFAVLSGDAVPALYQAISASVPANNVVEFMEIASKASIGGITSLETAVDGLTSVVNTYGSEVITAGQVSDIMFTTVKLGKTDFNQLSRTLYNVIPTAKSLGVGFDQVGAALATMTAQGVPTAQATTQLRQLFVELSKDTKLSQSVMATFGKSFADLTKDGMSFADVMQGVRDSMPEAEFRKLFSSVEAQGAALLTTGDALDRFKNALEETSDAAGATDAAFKTMSETASFKMDKALAAVKLAMEDLGTAILPAVATVMESVLVPAVQLLSDGLNSVSEWVTDNRSLLDGVKTAFAGIGEAVGDLLEQLGQLALPNLQLPGLDGEQVSVWQALGQGINAALTATVAFVEYFLGGIEAMVTGVTWLLTNWETLSTTVQLAVIAVAGLITAKLIPVFIGLGAAVVKALAGVLLAIGPVGWIALAVAAAVAGIGYLYQNWDEVKPWLDRKWAQIQGLFDDGMADVKTLFSEAWANVQTTIRQYWTAIALWLGIKFFTLRDALREGWQKVQESTGEIWSGIVSTIQEKWGEIKSWWAVQTIIWRLRWRVWWRDLRLWVSETWDGIKTTAEQKWRQIRTTLSVRAGQAFDQIKSRVGIAIAAIKLVVTNVWQTVQTAWTPLLARLRTRAGQAFDQLKSRVSLAIAAVKLIVTGIWNSVQAAWTPLLARLRVRAGQAFDQIKSRISIAVAAVRLVAEGVWNTVQTKWLPYLASLPIRAGRAFDQVKTRVGIAVAAVKLAVTNIWQTVQTAWSGALLRLRIRAGRPLTRSGLASASPSPQFSRRRPISGRR